MKNTPKVAWFTPILMAFSWIGLSGLADGLVEWRDWYEIGVIQHWRSVKDWIGNVLLFWLPFTIPSWLIDMSLVGVVWCRSGILAISWHFRNLSEDDVPTNSGDDQQPNVKKSRLEIIVVAVISTLTVPLLLLGWAVFWPIAFLLNLLYVVVEATGRNLPMGLEKEELFGAAEPKHVLTNFCLTVMLFFPFLFVVTNELPELLDKW